jgi:hypothetical protein
MYTLEQALVTSRLDYDNALLYGLPKKTIAPLQRVQNAVSPVLHHLPVENWVQTENITHILYKE